MTRPRLALLVIVALALLTAVFVLNRECGYGGGMPGWYRDCHCIGTERVDYDHTQADGKRRTTCLGVVVARSCHAYRGGPAVSCNQLPDR
jgi:hypothetical protein